MLFETIMAGFGGQGILFMGDMLAEVALREGRFATFLPTYGVAMRGGTANCVVTISDEDIGSPVLDHPHAGIFMNAPSLAKFQGIIRPNGIIVANASLIQEDVFARAGEVRLIWLPAGDIAREVAGTERSANVVALGAILATDPVANVATFEAVIREVAFAGKPQLVDKNIAALHAGLDFAVSAAKDAKDA